MYPPGIMPPMSGYGYPHLFYGAFPFIIPPPISSNSLFFIAFSNPPPPSSPISVGSDPVKRLERYIRWHIKWTAAREESFLNALNELNDREYEFSDIKTITDAEWSKMGVKEGIYKALRREIKPFTHWLRLNGDEHDVDSDDASDRASSGAGGDK